MRVVRKVLLAPGELASMGISFGSDKDAKPWLLLTLPCPEELVQI